MSATTAAGPRIATLDIIRGVAVMGILAMNITVFAMPPEAYLNPIAYGMTGSADYVSWVFGFILFDGKMRGLFSLLFGASMLLVIERAEAGERNPATVHYRRMLWLMVFGLLHYFLIWYGDILFLYAVIGMIAWFFRHKAPHALLFLAGLFIILQFAGMAFLTSAFFNVAEAASAPVSDPGAMAAWNEMQRGFGIPSEAALRETLALFRGSWEGLVAYRWNETWHEPAQFVLLFGLETLGYMLIGMAGFRSGFLTGAWDDAALRRVATIGFAIGVPGYAALAAVQIADGFSVPIIFATMAATTLLRPPMIVAIAALVILLTRRGGALVDRIAAAGRAAFTNYLGTSILMTALFNGWGLGLFGKVGRPEQWLVVLGGWALMLLWSKPWLDRFRYGPFEWLWRTLARGRLQPLRRAPASV